MKPVLILLACLLATSLHAEITQTRAHGFHWYSPPTPVKRALSQTPPATPTPKPSPYEELMAIRQQTRNKLARALIDPSFTATVEYMKAQQVYAKHNQAFVRFWQQALLTHPELDNT